VTLPHKLKRYLEMLAAEDSRMLLETALRKLTHPLLNMYYVFEFELASVNQIPAKEFPAGIALRLFRGEGDIAYVAATLSAAGVPVERVEERMRRGDLAALILANDEELVAYSWTTFGHAWLAEVGATLPLRPDEAVRFDSMMMPRWRGKGFNYILSIPISRYLYEHGYRRTFSWVNALNTRSIKTQLRQGKRRIAIIISSPVFGIVRVRNLSPEAGITLERRKPAAITP
jgi:hypothetical protein